MNNRTLLALRIVLFTVGALSGRLIFGGGETAASKNHSKWIKVSRPIKNEIEPTQIVTAALYFDPVASYNDPGYNLHIERILRVDSGTAWIIRHLLHDAVGEWVRLCLEDKTRINGKWHIKVNEELRQLVIRKLDDRCFQLLTPEQRYLLAFYAALDFKRIFSANSLELSLENDGNVLFLKTSFQDDQGSYIELADFPYSSLMHLVQSLESK